MMKDLKVFVCLLTIFGFVAQADARTVRVGSPAPSISEVALYAAKQKGYYRDEGIDLELILMASPVANLALIAGEVDFTTVPTAGLTAAIQGAPLRILFSPFNRPLFWLYAKPNIHDMKGLKGKKVGSTGRASADDTLLREILKKYGLEPGRDVPILNIGNSPTRFSALMNGSVDACALAIPWNIKAAASGFRELISFVNEELVHLTGSLVVNERLLKSDLLLSDKFIRGTLKGFLYARNNRPGTIPLIARHLQIKEDLAANIYDLAQPAMTSHGIVSEQLQRKALELVLNVQGQKEVPPFEKFFDFSLTRGMDAELKAHGWRP